MRIVHGKFLALYSLKFFMNKIRSEIYIYTYLLIFWLRERNKELKKFNFFEKLFYINHYSWDGVFRSVAFLTYYLEFVFISSRSYFYFIFKVFWKNLILLFKRATALLSMGTIIIDFFNFNFYVFLYFFTGCHKKLVSPFKK